MGFMDEDGYSWLACRCWATQYFNRNFLFNNNSVWSYDQRAVYLLIKYVYIFAIINIMGLCITGYHIINQIYT